jgi:hypothetical protein
LVNKEINNEEKDRRKVKKELKEPRKYRASSFALNSRKKYHRAKKERTVLRTVKRRKANWVGDSLRRNFPLKHVIEGKVEGMIEDVSRYWMTLRKREATGS